MVEYGLNLTINDVQKDSSRRNTLLPSTGLEPVALMRFTFTQIKIPEEGKAITQSSQSRTWLLSWNWAFETLNQVGVWVSVSPRTKPLLAEALWAGASGHHDAPDPQVGSGLSSLQRDLVELWLAKVKRWKSASSLWKICPVGFCSYFKICMTVWRKKRWEGQKTFFFSEGFLYLYPRLQQ